MRIDSSGQVLIGCTTFTSSTPGATIENSANTAGRINLVKTATGARDALALYYAGNYVGGIVYTDTQTALVGSSDYRLKENIIDLEHAVDRIKNLLPKRFNFLVEPNKTIDGFIAHEVQDIVPEAVFGEKDATREEQYEVRAAVLNDEGKQVIPAVMGTRTVPAYQGIDQSKFIPLLTAALQETIAKVEALEAEVSKLRSK